MVASSTTMSWAVAMMARARPSRGTAGSELSLAASGAATILISRADTPSGAACCPVSCVADK
jgi:hypothetical protein